MLILLSLGRPAFYHFGLQIKRPSGAFLHSFRAPQLHGSSRLGAEQMETFELLLEAYRASRAEAGDALRMSHFLDWLQDPQKEAWLGARGAIRT